MPGVPGFPFPLDPARVLRRYGRETSALVDRPELRQVYEAALAEAVTLVRPAIAYAVHPVVVAEAERLIIGEGQALEGTGGPSRHLGEVEGVKAPPPPDPGAEPLAALRQQGAHRTRPRSGHRHRDAGVRAAAALQVHLLCRGPGHKRPHARRGLILRLLRHAPSLPALGEHDSGRLANS